ncbi:MAG TPA: hypothetical protein PLC89_27615 [Haliscomenobacter sp.]|uniref:hypothetical protein n=1 Tax=Haliscomenobacter sp. TaxID=2717303 RepID=UPI002B9038FC|nr:hypothetical protein [Haliscomenobacter sp.]HOY21112.1 hypothetical protein [Haliscomenobacter sp.]
MSKPFTYLIALVFVLSALVFPNQSLYIGDELSYLNRGFAIAQFERELHIRDHFSRDWIDLIPADYPLGNSFFIAGSILLGGVPAAHIGPVLALVLSFLITAATLRKLGQESSGALLVFWYPAALLLSRMLMSDVWSLLVVAAFFGVYFGWESGKKQYIALGFLAGFSLWFRETNGLVFVIPLLYLGLKAPRHTLYLLMGGLLGLLPRLLSAAWIYGDCFFVKNPNISFGWVHLPINVPLYALYVSLFFPFSFWVLFRFRTPAQQVLHASFWLFVGVYVLYGYTGLTESGYKGLFLSSRFLIPLLPLYIYALAASPPAFLQQKTWVQLSRVLPYATLVLLLGFNYGIYRLGLPTQTFRNFLRQQLQDDNKVLIVDPKNEIMEVIAPFILERASSIRLSTLESVRGISRPQEEMLYLKVSRRDNPYQVRKYQNLEQKENQILGGYTLQRIVVTEDFSQKMEVFQLLKNE